MPINVDRNFIEGTYMFVMLLNLKKVRNIVLAL
jgi:hypothetical protein